MVSFTKQTIPKMNRRTRRQSSNIFHMLGKNQIVELRETFSLLDSNSDGLITKEDLENFLDSIGSPFTTREIDEMMKEMGNSFSFMTFITMIGEKLSATDSESDIRQALCSYKDEAELRTWLGKDLIESDLNLLLRGCTSNGKIEVDKLTSKIKYGEIIHE